MSLLSIAHLLTWNLTSLSSFRCAINCLRSFQHIEVSCLPQMKQEQEQDKEGKLEQENKKNNKDNCNYNINNETMIVMIRHCEVKARCNVS